MRIFDRITVFAGFLALLMLSTWALPLVARAEGGVAVVDMERAVNETAAGKRAQAELRRKFEKLQSELKVLNDEVVNLRKDLENTAVLLKPEAKLAKEREFERKASLLNNRKRDASQEVNEAQRDAFAPILQEMSKIIGDLGTRNGYTLIMEAHGPLYYAKSVDITAQVIAAYDKLHP